MTITKEAFVDLQEKYNKVIKLIQDDSKLDPETEPYLSKYSARNILISMKANLENLLRNQRDDSPERLKLIAMLAAVQLYLGTVAVDTQELSTGEGHLEKCHELIKDDLMRPEVNMVALNMFNQYGIIWSLREPEKAKQYLEKAEQLYSSYKELGTAPVDIYDLFNLTPQENTVEVTQKNYEKIYTFTLYYLAQIYGVLKDSLKSSIYCHLTLQRQLDSDDYDPIDWALNAATLSQFFIEKNGLRQARHHLAASSFILEKYERELSATTDRNEAYEAKLEEFKHRSADVARCWAKYGLSLLLKSKERLLNQAEHLDIDEDGTITTNMNSLNLDQELSMSTEEIENLDFKGLDLSAHEAQITDKFILILPGARAVFLNVQSWITKAETYYTLETLASDHIEIVQDHSQLYANFCFFEDKPENQAKLQKRRIDLLENIIAKVNPQYYLQYCRQIWFDLGQIYGEILNIKSDKLRETNDRPSPNALTKINHLIERSIHYFTCFIDSFKEGSNGELPRRIVEELEKPFLQAYFHIAALHSRFITLDKQIQLDNTERSHDYYKKVVDYCNENEKAIELIRMEHGICKEMVCLLPLKIAKLQQEIA